MVLMPGMKQELGSVAVMAESAVEFDTEAGVVVVVGFVLDIAVGLVESEVYSVVKKQLSLG